jgi:hypothetical protein
VGRGRRAEGRGVKGQERGRRKEREEGKEGKEGKERKEGKEGNEGKKGKEKGKEKGKRRNGYGKIREEVSKKEVGRKVRSLRVKKKREEGE